MREVERGIKWWQEDNKRERNFPMEWTIKYIQRTYISIITVDPDIYAYEVYMYTFKVYTDTLQEYTNTH